MCILGYFGVVLTPGTAISTYHRLYEDHPRWTSWRQRRSHLHEARVEKKNLVEVLQWSALVPLGSLVSGLLAHTIRYTNVNSIHATRPKSAYISGHSRIGEKRTEGETENERQDRETVRLAHEGRK